MKRSTVFLVLAIVGAVVPYASFLGYVGSQGFGLHFFTAVFANGAAAGFALDLVLASVAFWLWMLPDARARGISTRWPYLVLNLTIGLSCALPAYLWARSRLEEAEFSRVAS